VERWVRVSLGWAALGAVLGAILGVAYSVTDQHSVGVAVAIAVSGSALGALAAFGIVSSGFVREEMRRRDAWKRVRP
jgi:hypothetical protein